MKLICGVLFVCAVAQAANIDWNKVYPMEVHPYGSNQLRRTSNIEGRIVGGQEAAKHQFPHQVAIFLQINEQVFLCGGSLISNEWILTAAQCVEPASNFTVYLGAHNITKYEPFRIELKTAEKIVHPEYNRLGISNDIALLKLPYPIELSDIIQTIRLPSRSQQQESFTGQNSVASGWGKVTDSTIGLSPVLRYVENPIISNADCEEEILGLGLIKPTHICQSGKGKKTTCGGDNGGPLTIIDADGENTIVGITSFGLIFGCELGIPGGFTRVTSYLDFIESSTGIQIRP